MQTVRNKMTTLQAKLKETIGAAEDSEKELEDIINKSEQLEAETEEETARLNEIEDQLDAAETKLQGYTESLAASLKNQEEGIHAHKQLENRGKNDSNMLSKREIELEELQASNAGITGTLEEVSTELVECEEKLDIEEERCDKNDVRVKELESEVTQTGNALRSMEICEQDSGTRSEGGNAKITDMEIKYKESDARATEFEERAKGLEEDSDASEESLIAAKDKYEATKQELDALIAEIAEM